MTPSNHAEPSRLQRSLSDIDFVFVDIGASGELPPRFDSLQKYADLIRFDPDARDIRTVENILGRIEKGVAGIETVLPPFRGRAGTNRVCNRRQHDERNYPSVESPSTRLHNLIVRPRGQTCQC